jgi:hypothetical protein
MKTSVKLALSIVVLGGFSLQAFAAAPPPLKPAQILPTTGSSKPAKTDPVKQAPAVDPVKQAPVTQNAPVQIKAPKAPSAKKPTHKPAQKAQAKATEKSEEKLDRAAVLFNKCIAIEKLSSRKSAIRCMDRFLDRMDIEVGNVETRIMNCGELRRIENFENGENVRAKVVGEMRKLRQIQEDQIANNIMEVSKSGVKVGPRKMKEIELRAAEMHSKSAEKLADLVCSKHAFAMLMERN